jgi:putative metalloprotease
MEGFLLWLNLPARDKMSDDEVRYVIGHETGHVAKGHTRKALQTACTTSSLRKTGAASGNEDVARSSESPLAGLTEKLVHAQFSQSQEHEAEQYAVGFMKTNGYDPKAAVSALRKLEQLFGNQSSACSSHPAPGARAKALEKQV